MPPHHIVKVEKEYSIEEIGLFLQSIGLELEKNKKTEIGGQKIEPDPTSLFKVRYEKMPRGELKIVFEIEWNRHIASYREGVDIVRGKIFGNEE